MRKIIRIDEDKCNGCGLCVPACEEGAIQIIDGKARLVSEVYCDGLGACLGECPEDAITIEEREAEPFDEQAVKKHLEGMDEKAGAPVEQPRIERSAEGFGGGCPGSLSRMLGDRNREAGKEPTAPGADKARSELSNWPVQLKLAPLQAPYFEDARLLISGDCVPFAMGDFHSRLLRGRTLLMACPKLDDADFYIEKLTGLFRRNTIRSVDVAVMEVPCCFGLVTLVKAAIRSSGREIPVEFHKVSIRGEVLETVPAAAL